MSTVWESSAEHQPPELAGTVCENRFCEAKEAAASIRAVKAELLLVA